MIVIYGCGEIRELPMPVIQKLRINLESLIVISPGQVIRECRYLIGEF
jgi:hypothetical protein